MEHFANPLVWSGILTIFVGVVNILMILFSKQFRHQGWFLFGAIIFVSVLSSGYYTLINNW